MNSQVEQKEEENALLRQDIDTLRDQLIQITAENKRLHQETTALKLDKLP